MGDASTACVYDGASLMMIDSFYVRVLEYYEKIILKNKSLFNDHIPSTDLKSDAVPTEGTCFLPAWVTGLLSMFCFFSAEYFAKTTPKHTKTNNEKTPSTATAIVRPFTLLYEFSTFSVPYLSWSYDSSSLTSSFPTIDTGFRLTAPGVKVPRMLLE